MLGARRPDSRVGRGARGGGTRRGCRLTPEQRAGINAYHERLLSALSAAHDVDTSDAQHQLSLGMRIASLLGAVALTGAWCSSSSISAIAWAPRRPDASRLQEMIDGHTRLFVVDVDMDADRPSSINVPRPF